MEIVRIFSNTPKYTLQRKKLLSKHGISVPIEKFVLAFANPGVDGGTYRLRTNIQGENSGLIRQRLTLPLHSIEGNVRRAKSGRSRYQPSEWTQRERERRGRQLCEIHISSLSCNRYPRSTRLPRSPAPRWQPLFRDGDDPFCDDESRRRCADVDEVYGAAITRHGASS